MESSINKYGSRIHSLDALRGLAAFSVFLGHWLGISSPTPSLEGVKNLPIHFLYDGAPAVVLFFVLSGYVLSLQLLRIEHSVGQYSGYVIRRAMRILPAYYAVLLIALALRWMSDINISTNYSEWILTFWKSEIPFGEVIKHAILIGFWPDTHLINPVIWSLIIELRCSLLLPVFVYFINKSSRVGELMSLFVVVLAGVMVQVFAYMPLFILGALIAKYHKMLETWMGYIKWWGVVGLGICGIGMYSVKDWMSPVIASTVWGDYVVGVGASIVIVLVGFVYDARKIFEKGILQFMGKISYSFYLLHLPVMIYLVHSSLFAPFGPFGVGLLSLIIAIPVSLLLYKYVELPWIDLSKKISTVRQLVVR